MLIDANQVDASYKTLLKCCDISWVDSLGTQIYCWYFCWYTHKQHYELPLFIMYLNIKYVSGHWYHILKTSFLAGFFMPVNQSLSAL